MKANTTMADEIIHGFRDFHHPYKPYEIQEIFMETVYQVLEKGQVGILESPTGTGKSLSLICGAITWLRDHKGKMFEQGLEELQKNKEEPEWVIEQVKARRRREMVHQREDFELRLSQIRAKEKAIRDKFLRGERSSKKRKINHTNVDKHDDEQFVLEEYESDEDKKTHDKTARSLYSAETLLLLDELGMGPAADRKQDDEEIYDETKIYFCSRTHSQLTQFINELRRPKFPPSIVNSNDKEEKFEDLKHLTLGSRKNLCINPGVNRLGSLTAINERCTELQQSSTDSAKKCAFLPSEESQALVNSFRDHSLATIKDIEDMNSLGKEIGICPYYASRSAIKPAEIVTLPYPLLLQKTAREALGINLKGNIVIIDEAHNLMDAISAINSVEISLKQLKQAREQLGIYLLKFRNRLKGKNRVYIAQVIRLLDSLIEYLGKLGLSSQTDGTVSEKDLFAAKGIDQINLFKLTNYLQRSKIARKVEGYVAQTKVLALAKKPKTFDSVDPSQENSTPVIYRLIPLLLALTSPQKEGRLFFSKTSQEHVLLRYLLLDSSTQFREVVSSARAVVLAGGTMSPMSDYTFHLFPYIDENQINTLSCGHVIPKSNLLAWDLSKGPNEVEFEFTFKTLNNIDMIDELGRALLNICAVVPDGIIVFLPSYNYLNSVLTRWSVKDANSQSILQRLDTKKPIFKESKSESADATLHEYSRAIYSQRGGLLFSVVGGKMSEGINFSDALGRCVIIIGLPFPNIKSAEWKARIDYIETSSIERLKALHVAEGYNLDDISEKKKAEWKKKATELGKDFYENACMRAVNQSIGRVIRHKEDYAAILMIDQRFGSERIKKKLPGWIKDSMISKAGEKRFGILMGELSSFFRSKKSS
ncbi:unnamed protein product [Blumeria hordei]|uniref:ATP-dependent DNA helicase CHL1 n=1 Tax=Blumeria hordei TaxID=2867405 RepID=A0A383UTI9_BLUHO|nr:unnamed protein product [Blumeria hordei]